MRLRSPFLLRQCERTVLELRGHRLMKKLFFVIAWCFSQSALSAEDEISSLLTMSLAELGQVQVSTSATLAATPLDKVPASVTLISREMIENSGARDLYELVDIHTPGFQRMLSHTAGTGNAVGLRGLIHSDKFLIMVNGQVMSDRTQPLARTEHSLALLGDINYIEVVRGPGSSVYGPGAITGIIHIHTFDSTSFEGFEASFRQGFGGQFNALDLKWGHRFNEDTGVFVYYGIDNYDGADASDAPYINSTSFNSGSVNVVAGQPIAGISNDRAAFRGMLRHKLQMQLDGDKYKAWIRYTKGGEQFVSPWSQLNNAGSLLPEKQASGYEQITGAFEYEDKLIGEMSSRFIASYQIVSHAYQRPDVEAQQNIPAFEHQRSDRFLLRNVNTIDFDFDASFAFGFEFARNEFGRSSFFYPDADPIVRSSLAAFPDGKIRKWHTTTTALFGEYTTPGQ